MQLTLSTMALETGNTLLSPIDQDLLLSWVALILMTLQETGVPVEPVAPPRPPHTTTPEGFHMSEGMRGFARHIIEQYCQQGLTFARLQMTQSLANMDGDSPSVRVMQQNTRLVVITLEVLRDNQVATAMPIVPCDLEGAGLDRPNDGALQAPTPHEASTLDQEPYSPAADESLARNAQDDEACRAQDTVVVNGYREAMSMDGVISSMDYVYCFVSESKQVSAMTRRMKTTTTHSVYQQKGQHCSGSWGPNQSSQQRNPAAHLLHGRSVSEPLFCHCAG